jgi:DNA modification methylase
VLIVSDVLVFLRKIPDNSVNLVIADPPYYKIAKEAWDHQWDTPDEYLAWCREWLMEIARILKPGGSLYLWGTMKNTSIFLLKISVMAPIQALQHETEIVWSYDSGGKRRDHFGYKHQYALAYSKVGAPVVFYRDAISVERSIKRNPNTGEALTTGKIPTCVWVVNSHTMSKEKRSANWHPTPKPFAVCRRIIEAHTEEGDVIVVPFSGSGSELIVGEALGRAVYAADISAEYVEKTRIRQSEFEGVEMPRLTK